MRILLDCDGVLCDFVGGMCEELNHHGFRYVPEDFKEFRMEKFLTPNARMVFDFAFGCSGFCEGLEWYPGAKEFLKALRLHTVHIVTAPGRCETWDEERRNWLKGHVNPEDIAFCHASFKPRISGDILIEDNADTGLAWLQENPSGILLLIDRPWNRSIEVRERAHRVYGYSQALYLIDWYAGEEGSPIRDTLTGAA